MDVDAAPAHAGPAGGLRERAFVPTLLVIGAVISIISSLGAPLIPLLAEDLDTSLASAQWALTATLLVGAVASPILGRLGDGPHRKTVILLCLVSVTAGGVLAAMGDVLWLVIVGRAMQGLGLALLPLAMAAARDRLPREAATRAIAALSVITPVGVGLGYPLTGLAAKVAGPSGAFWAGVVLTAIALALALVVLPGDPGGTGVDRTLDVRGAALIAIGLVGLLLGVEKGTDWGWTAPGTLALLAIAVVFLSWWTEHELGTPSPLVDLRLVRHRAVLTADVAAVTLGAAMYLWMSLLTQFVQLDPAAYGFGLGETVFVAGLTLLPLSVGSFVSSRFLPVLRRTIGGRRIIPLGALTVGAGQLLFALTADALWQAFVTMGIVGLGLGLTFAAMPVLVIQATPRAETGSAMGFYQVSRYVGFAIGSGLAVTFLRALGTDGEPTLAAYRWTLVIGAALCTLTAVIAWVLPGRDAVRDPDPELERLQIEEGPVGAAGLEMLHERARP